MWAERWPAVAKLNLMLRIVGQRNDGYHLLQTVFQFVDVCDWITFHPVEGGGGWFVAYNTGRGRVRRSYSKGSKLT